MTAGGGGRIGGGGRLGDGGIEQTGKRTHGHGQQGGDRWRRGGIKEPNGNGKKIQ